MIKITIEEDYLMTLQDPPLQIHLKTADLVHLNNGESEQNVAFQGDEEDEGS